MICIFSATTSNLDPSPSTNTAATDSVVLSLSLALGMILLADCVAVVILAILLVYFNCRNYRRNRDNTNTTTDGAKDDTKTDEPQYATVQPVTPSDQQAENIELNTNLSYSKTPHIIENPYETAT